MDKLHENSFVINIASVNGSGTQTANSVLLRSLFRMGVPVGGKNIFPSNISGMPTWFWIRANSKGYVGATSRADIVLAFNPQTFEADQSCLGSGGFFFYPEGKTAGKSVRPDIVAVPIPLQSLTDKIVAPIKIKKLAANMIYVGILSELLTIPQEIVRQVVNDQLEKKTSALQPNLDALDIGRQYARENLQHLAWPFVARTTDVPRNQVMMDGNTAAALGLLAGGCQFISWYPITPSTSVVEHFERFAKNTRKDKDGKNNFAVIQAEDELAAFAMVLGAGWAGTRALTATSGPGLSLMAEGAGYAYYAEIPAVVWNVQRLGPSTGLPTRTAQGDLTFSAHLSHGDAKHILLFPGSIQECFEFGQTCFDLAERLQQLVIVLSDLDLGMNLWSSEELKSAPVRYDRGKVLSPEDLDKLTHFHRYEDQDGDGICARTLPGNSHPRAAYFTRGSGHNFRGQYSEKAEEYSDNILRLQRKWETAKKLVPAPEIKSNDNKEGMIYFGSTSAVVEELTELLEQKNQKFDLCRIRAYPFSPGLEDFMKEHEAVYVIEQNRDGQMKALLAQAYPQWASKMVSILHFDGTPVTAEGLRHKILNLRGEA
ncbi:2-oxoacid:acceptor oxidoreductase subunit alpha [Bdellovibrio sp.]|uniref:2-oxoacid:acceptor oxidoreductase subunit alpha n=1 Tax=Bdellovibrio sp. TaxID=28201 RepID=UPI003221C6CE